MVRLDACGIIPPSIAITGMILMWVATFSGLELIGMDELDFLSPLVFVSGIGMQIYWLYKKDVFQ